MLLFSFIEKYKFNKENLNYINNNGVTPLTIAIAENQEDVVLALLELNANPLIENVHGNSPLTLSLQQPWSLKIIKPAIVNQTCPTFNCKVNENFYYNNKTYIITKILQGGSCSLAAVEIQNRHTLEKHFAKIKSCFGGLEIRNYIFLEQYVDLFMIEKLILYNNKQEAINIIENVYCLIQKIVPGETLSVALTSAQSADEKQFIIISAIKSLCELHAKGCVHNDALPGNCFWEKETRTVTFIDYDVMRTLADFNRVEQYGWEEAEYLDLNRLITGDKTVQDGVVSYGLMYYTENMKNILENFDSSVLDPKIKNRLVYCFF